MKDFFTKYPRVVTGLIILVILVAALIFGGWLLRLLLLVTALTGLYEFYRIYWPEGQKIPSKILGLTLAAALVLTQGSSPWWTVGLMAASFVIPALGFLFDYGRGNDAARLEDYSVLSLGILYIPLLLMLAMHLSRAEQILVILAPVATDTLGYYVGINFGRHKIWPRVSPKKSWQGSIGGLVGCALVVTVFGAVGVWRGLQLPTFPWWCWLAVGILLNVASQLGDFFESALKRSAGVKDTSSLLPGHGGVMDRIDSFLFAVPTYMLVKLVMLALGLAGGETGGDTVYVFPVENPFSFFFGQ